MKIEEIQDLIKFVSKSGISEVEIEDKDFKINIKTPPFKRGKGNGEQQQVVPQIIPGQVPQMQTQAIQQAPAQPQSESTKEEKQEDANYIEVKSPMIGTFYRRPSPDKAEFVKVGDNVSVGDTLCVIEAMKLFNEIESEVSGKVVKVLSDDITPVEYDQPLFLIDPEG